MKVSGIPYIQGRNDYDDTDGLKFGIAIHNTSNDATAREEANYATNRTDGVSSHLYADPIEVIQSVDTADRCGHAGSKNGNENAVCVEITGTNGKSRDWWLKNVAWDKLGAALAQIIRAHWPDGSFQVRRASVSEMKANPKVKAFYGHDDMRLAWGGTTHTDPGPNFPWDRLFEAVNNALGAEMADTASQVNNLYQAYFYGGSSCGKSVADKYRTLKMSNGQPVIEDGKPVFLNPHGNSLIEQLAEIRGELAQVLATQGEGGGGDPFPSRLRVSGVLAVESVDEGDVSP